MAIVWEKRTAAGHYQIRSAGQTLRLYKDGVYHSHYNPRQKVSRGVWDLLLLPALLLPPGSIRKVLLLGVGGGAAIHLLNHFVAPKQIKAIELDDTHLRVAKRFFKVAYANTELIHGDAIAWVKKQTKRKRVPTFDLIIDDLYGEEDGEPVRAVQADRQWCDQLDTLLNNDGIIVSNFVAREELRQSAYLSNRSLRRRFTSAYRFSNPKYENQIGAFSKQCCSRRTLSRNMAAHPELRSHGFQDSFSVRKL